MRLELFDLTGRRTRVLAAGPMSRGEHLVTWDRRDDQGTVVESGVYFARLSTLHQQVTLPVSVLH